MKRDLKNRLTSRKFWLSVTGFISMAILAFGGTQETAVKVTALCLAGADIIAYVLSSSFVDAKWAEVEIAKADSGGDDDA